MRRCVVIGGGLAGLAAALRLASTPGNSVTILEAAPAFGGRVRSFIDRASGQEIDNGQHVLMGACHAALQYLDDVGAVGGLDRLHGMALPFAHVDGRRSRLQAAALPHPLSLVMAFLRYDMLAPTARLRVLRFALRLRGISVAALERLDRRTVTEWLHACGQQDEEIGLFWTPVVLATMNSEPAAASAKLFAVLLREIFLGGRDNADMLLPSLPLSGLFIEPALTALRNRGAVLRPGAGASSIEVRGSGGQRFVTGVQCAGEYNPADLVVCAVPPWAFARLVLAEANPTNGGQNEDRLSNVLLPGTDLTAFAPSEILSIHVWLRRDVGLRPMTGLLGTEIQWVFRKGKTEDKLFHYSCTISSARGDETDDAAELRALVLRELALLDSALTDDDIVRLLPIREKRATFIPRPGLEGLRPSARTAIPGLFLAGDWTSTGLPATIEGAIRSGFTAAELASP